MLINAVDQRVRWATGEATGPSTNVVTLIVRDNAFPSLSATGQVVVVVNEVKSPPVFSPIDDLVANEGELLTFGLVANDYDLPTQKLTYRLASGAPAGLSVNPLTGMVS
jgi:hypothetical protein